MMKLCTSVLLGGLVILSADAKSTQQSKLSNDNFSAMKSQLKKELLAELRAEGYSINKTAGKEETIKEAQGSYRVSEAETASEEKKEWDAAKREGRSAAVVKKGFLQIPGTASYIRPYGFANMKLAVTRHQNASGYASDMPVSPEKVAHDEEGRRKKNDYNFLASDSRFGIETFSMARIRNSEVPLKTLFEFDFSGGDENSATISNKYKVKVRHVYMTVGNFLAGLTTSTFIDPAAAPEITGPGVVGSSTKRVPQIRYVVECNNVEIRYALERIFSAYYYTKTDGKNILLKSKDSYTPKTRASDDGKYHSSDILPSAVIAIKIKNDHAHLGMAGALRYLKVTNNIYYKDGTNEKEIFKPSKTIRSFGYGARLSGSYKFANKDSIFGSLTFGNGIGLFLADAEKSSIYVRGSNETLGMETNDAYGFVLGCRHFWTEKYNLRSTLVFGFSHLCNSRHLVRELATSELPQDLNKNLFTANVNLMFDVTNKFTCGFEFFHSMRKLVDGRRGSTQIFMFNASVAF